MRTAKFGLFTVPTAVPGALIAPASPGRALLTIGCPDGTDIVYLTSGPAVTVQDGFVISQSTGPMTLRREEVGDAIQWAWYAHASAGTQIAVLDVTDSAREVR